MITNYNVKVRAGKRTPIEVICVSTSVNTKTITMPNGKTITDEQIAGWIQHELQSALFEYGGLKRDD